jgi:hypothetical protein
MDERTVAELRVARYGARGSGCEFMGIAHRAEGMGHLTRRYGARLSDLSSVICRLLSVLCIVGFVRR